MSPMVCGTSFPGAGEKVADHQQAPPVADAFQRACAQAEVVVDDLDVGEAAVLALDATKHEYQPGTSFRVFLDPAGHPFCLWAD
jgi:hypothetical protein